MTDKLNAERLRALDEGPQLQRIMLTCQGCKHLTTEDWVEHPDGERDSGTSAWCNVGEKRNLSAYWSARNQPPSWCPFPTPAILAMAEERERSEKHRNDLYDKVMAQVTEIGALKADNARMREALEGLQGDGTATGTWLEAVEPLIARFNVAAQFGADAVHNGTGAKAIADLMQSMADRLDRACISSRLALGKDQADG